MDLSNIFQKLVTAPLDTGTASIDGTPLNQEVLRKLYDLIEQDYAELSREEKSLITRNLQTLETIDPSCKEQVEKVRQVLIARNGFSFSKQTFEEAKEEASTHPKEFLLGNLENYALQEEEKKAVLTIAVEKLIKENCFFEDTAFCHMEDKQFLASLLQIAAAQSGRSVSKNIQEYGIQDEKALIEIALVAAVQSGWGVSQYIQNYKIKEEKVLIEIALVAVAQSGVGVSRHIQNYGIQDQKALTEIALVAAAQSGWGVSKHIQKYGIQEQKDLIEIAKVAAAQDGRGVSSYIQNYGIQNKEALIEMAKITILQNPESLQLIDNYGIKDQGFLRALPKMGQFPSILHEVVGGEKDRWTLITSFLVKEAFEEKFLTDISSALSVEDPKKRFSSAMTLLMQSRLSSLALSSEEQEKTLKEVSTYRNPLIALALACLLGKGSFLTNFSSIYQTCIQKEGALGVNRILPSIIPSYWMASLKDRELDKKRWTDFLDQRLVLTILKDQKKPLLQMMLLCSMGLEQSSLPTEKKLQVFLAACDLFFLPKEGNRKGLQELLMKELVKRFSLIRLFCKLDPSLFNQEVSGKDLAVVLSIHLQTMLQKSGIDLSKIDHFADCYMETFGQMRVPCALETYLGALGANAEEGVKNALNRFVTGVVQGTLAEERVQGSPHLEYIKTQFPGLLEKFHQEVERIDLTEGTKGSEPISYETFFQNKLQDGHWKKGTEDLLPVLTKFVQAGEVQRKAMVEELLQKELKEPVDLLQEACMKVLLEKDPLKQKEALQEAHNVLKASFSELEFCHDIEGLLQVKASTSQEYIIKSTDWQDLFLSGTEVAGSCQRVDGDPLLNKCLLAYCLDGKNTIIAVKDPKEKILARAVFRLLLDEEKKPVLFLDRIYPDPCPASRKEAIQKMALKSAKELNLPLLTQDWDGSSPYPGTIQSLGSNCPYEYADAGGGVMKEGVFMINNVRQIL